MANIVYFVVQGHASYVLPRFENHQYFKIELGDHFGHIDLGQDVNYFKKQKRASRTKRKPQVYHRKFTIQAQETCDLLTLSISDLDKMFKEFPDLSVEIAN